MELLSNLAWLVASIVLIVAVWRGRKAGMASVDARTAFVLAVLICFLMLPAISLSDNILEARQAVLPISSQAWHAVSQNMLSVLWSVVVAFASALLAMLLSHRTAAGHAEDEGVFTFWTDHVRGVRPPPVLVF